MPRKRKPAHRSLCVVMDAAREGRANPVVLRTLRTVAALTAARGRGNKRNPQMLYDLARWVITAGQTRRRALGNFIVTRTDQPYDAAKQFISDQLFELLQRHGQIGQAVPYWGALAPGEVGKLEKRLRQQWPLVEEIAAALEAPERRMRAAKPAKAKTMRRRIARLKPADAWQLGLSNIAKGAIS